VGVALVCWLLSSPGAPGIPATFSQERGRAPQSATHKKTALAKRLLHVDRPHRFEYYIDVSYDQSRAAMTRCRLFSEPKMDEMATHPLASTDLDAILDAQVSEFLAEVEALDQESVQAATFKVYDHIEQLLFDRSFRLCDRILRSLDVSRFSTTVLRAFLTITWEHRLDLEERAGLYERVRGRMLEIRGPEVTERLLCRLA
jgi:hypothetical protein